MFRVDDNIDHEQMLRQRIWTLIDSIEDIASRAAGRDVMAHEIPAIADKLQRYQKQEIRPLYFYNFLCKYFDEIN